MRKGAKKTMEAEVKARQANLQPQTNEEYDDDEDNEPRNDDHLNEDFFVDGNDGERAPAEPHAELRNDDHLNEDFLVGDRAPAEQNAEAHVILQNDAENIPLCVCCRRNPAYPADHLTCLDCRQLVSVQGLQVVHQVRMQAQMIDNNLSDDVNQREPGGDNTNNDNEMIDVNQGEPGEDNANNDNQQEENELDDNNDDVQDEEIELNPDDPDDDDNDDDDNDDDLDENERKWVEYLKCE